MIRFHSFNVSLKEMVCASLPNLHEVDLWEEATAPAEIPCMHPENMWTPRRKAPAGLGTFLLWGESANHRTQQVMIL